MVKYKHLLTLLLFICPLLSMAQNHNVIVRLNGNVQIMQRNDKQWKTLHVRDTVKLIDMINISPNSSVSIMKTSTRAVYTANNSAQMTVYDIIKKAESSEMAVVNNILKENASTGGQNSQRDFTSYGASVRGGATSDETDAVYAYLYGVIENIYAHGEVKEYDNTPTISRIYADDTFSFKVTCVEGCTCYVNIYCINLSNRSVEACYPCNISTANVSSAVLMLPGEFYDSNDVVYLLVASTVDYDSSLISLKLRNGEKPQDSTDNDLVKCSLSPDARKLLLRHNK
jgi:hypothetical protein